MPDSLWIETKKEYEISDTGGEILKKVTREPKPEPAKFAKKDIIDLIFRTISVLAIGLPILLLFLQQKAAIRSQRSLQQYDVYSSASLELHSILRRSVNEPEFKKSQDKLSYELSPKIEFLYRKDVSDKMDEVNKSIGIYKAIINNDNIEDSLYSYEKEVGSNLSSLLLDHPEGKPVVIDDEHLRLLHLMDSTYNEISPSQLELQKLIKQNLTGNKTIRSALYDAVNLDSTYVFFHLNFVSTCDSIRQICNDKKNNKNESLQALTDSIGKQTENLFRYKSEMADSFKEIRKTMYNQLKLQIDNLKLSLREANQYLDTK